MNLEEMVVVTALFLLVVFGFSEVGFVVWVVGREGPLVGFVVWVVGREGPEVGSGELVVGSGELVVGSGELVVGSSGAITGP